MESNLYELGKIIREKEPTCNRCKVVIGVNYENLEIEFSKEIKGRLYIFGFIIFDCGTIMSNEYPIFDKPLTERYVRKYKKKLKKFIRKIET